MSDLTTVFGSGGKGDPLRLRNPVIAAAGTLASGFELGRDLDLSAIGALVTPAIRRRTRPVPPNRAILDVPAGVLIARPYPSLGLRSVLNRYAPLWERWDVPVIANLPCEDLDECLEVAETFADHAAIAAIELDLASAPGLLSSEAPSLVGDFCARLLAVWPRPLIAKLPLQGVGLPAVVAAATSAGADAVSLGGGFPGTVAVYRTDGPRPRYVTGSVVGPASRALALQVVSGVCAATSAPIIASGGITSGRDAADFLQAGARAVQVGSASLRDPTATLRVLRELEQILRAAGAATVAAYRRRDQADEARL